MFVNDQEIKKHLENAKTIAVIGFSKDPTKTAHNIPIYLTNFFTVIPVNPTTSEIKGFSCYKSIKDIPVPIDIVNIFRPGPDCENLMKEIVTLNPKPKLVWLQLRITNIQAKKLAEQYNIDYIEDKCIYVERERLLE
jgi:hypothetical protein